MSMLSDDDVNLVELSDDELDLAWELWFDLAQSTNDADPPYTHGVFATVAIAGPSAVNQHERRLPTPRTP